MRIPTGDYRVVFFDKYGGKLKLLEATTVSMTSGIEKGNHVVDTNEEAHSFIVLRQVFNSLDERGKW